jgi:PHD/YefM family antitoxin component YafN of YafNO toxin-antitoxin module
MLNGTLAVRANEISNDFIQRVKSTYKTQRVVVLAEKEYQKMQKEKEWRNAEYLSKLDKARAELAEGKGIVLSMEQLESMADE